MDEDTRRKIEGTVIHILKTTSMEEMTEYKVRVAASERLGIDLSPMDCKVLVRRVVENYLLSILEAQDKGKETQPNANAPDENEIRGPEQQIIPKKELNDDGSRVICQLSDKRNVTIHEFRGKTFVSIRQYYQKDGKQLPGAKGISLPTEQWSIFKGSVPAIEEAVLQMTKKLRSDSEQEAEKMDVAQNPATGVTPQNFPVETPQNFQVETPQNFPVETPQNFPVQTPQNFPVETPQNFPVETVRFDGNNYYAWARQMDFFLQRSKIAYVLSDPCPSVVSGSESGTQGAARSKAAEEKWISDDYTCRHTILNSLSDSLFHLYKKKTMSARELWEELKLIYLFEELGTKRSQVKHYVEFKLVEGKSMFEQVHELNILADSIAAAGMWIDENFHVSAIISKLPPSWKNVFVELMRQEHLPLLMLMDRLRIEDELRNQQSRSLFKMSFNPFDQHPILNRHVPRMGEPKFSTPQSNKRERQSDGKAVICYTCGQKGHISRNCLSLKVVSEVTNERRQPIPTEVNVAEDRK